MNPGRLLITSILCATCVICFSESGTIRFRPCHSIDIQVGKEYNESTGGTIAIDVKGLKLNEITINLIKPKGKKILDAKTLEFKNLERGEYIVIVTGKSMVNDYCPAYVKLLIE